MCERVTVFLPFSWEGVLACSRIVERSVNYCIVKKRLHPGKTWAASTVSYHRGKDDAHSPAPQATGR